MKILFDVICGSFDIRSDRPAGPYRIYYRNSEQAASLLEFWTLSAAIAECGDMEKA